MLRRTSEWGLLDHCDRPLHPTQQDHEGGCTTQQTSYKPTVGLATRGDSVDTYLSAGLWCTQSCSGLHTRRTHSTSIQWIFVFLHYRCIATWTWMEGAGPWCGNIPTWRFSPSPRPCTTSASTTGSAPTWRQDGATYQTRDTFSQHT